MVKPLSVSFMQVYGSVAEDLTKRIGDPMAIQAGPPVSEDIEPATDQQRAEAWWARRPEATDEAMLQLAAQKYAEHIQAGMPPEKAQAATAEDLTHFRYGQRLKLYSYGQVGYKAQVAEAKRLAKVAARESTPNPQPATPTMPSAAMTNAPLKGAPFDVYGQPGQTLPGGPAAQTVSLAPPAEQASTPPTPGGY